MIRFTEFLENYASTVKSNLKIMNKTVKMNSAHTNRESNTTKKLQNLDDKITSTSDPDVQDQLRAKKNNLINQRAYNIKKMAMKRTDAQARIQKNNLKLRSKSKTRPH